MPVAKDTSAAGAVAALQNKLGAMSAAEFNASLWLLYEIHEQIKVHDAHALRHLSKLHKGDWFSLLVAQYSADYAQEYLLQKAPPSGYYWKG